MTVALQRWQQAVCEVVTTQKNSSIRRLKSLGVTSSNASHRISIYRRGYVSRMGGSFEDDFPLLRKSVSSKQFEKLVKEFLHQIGSSRKSLTDLSWDFARFAQARVIASSANRAISSDLLVLEEALLTSMDDEHRSELSFSKRIKLELNNQELWLIDSKGSLLFEANVWPILKKIQNGTSLKACANLAVRLKMSSEELFELFRALSARGLLQQTKSKK